MYVNVITKFEITDTLLCLAIKSHVDWDSIVSDCRLEQAIFHLLVVIMLKEIWL